MVTDSQVLLYRKAVSSLLQSYRNALFVASGRSSYPTDASIAFKLGISPTALSSISRQCTSMSAIVLRILLIELSKLLSVDDFNLCMSHFVLDSSYGI